MPVRIGAIEDITPEEFQTLLRKKATKGNPEMEDLLNRVESGQAVRVPLEAGQSARGLRTAISRAARPRGMNVEMVQGVTDAGQGFVAVAQAQGATPSGGRRGAPSGNGRKRGRPRRQDADVAVGDEPAAEEEM